MPYGPIFPEAATMDDHRIVRAEVAALEKALCERLAQVGYQVLNTVNSKQALDPELWRSVFDAFSARFERIAAPTVDGVVGTPKV